jgi:hypothetical protein
VLTSDGTVYDRSKASFGVGMVAPHSFSRYRGQNLYLGLDGVNFETDSRYRSNKADREFLSDPVSNALLRDPQNMIDAAGIVVGDRYWLSYPGSDSSWVYLFKTGSWVLCDFDFYDAVLYDTLNRAEYSAYQDFLFVQDDDERIFHFSEADSTDNGEGFAGVLEKRGIARDPWNVSNVVAVSVQQTSAVQATDTLVIGLMDENGDTLAMVTVDSLDLMYRKEYILANDNKAFHHLNVVIELPNRTNLTINALDFDVQPAGQD